MVYPVLAAVSRCYPRVRGRFLTCYSPVRRFPPPEGGLSLDLHVLGAPPAFVLSQDQTLRRDLKPTRQTQLVVALPSAGKPTDEDQNRHLPNLQLVNPQSTTCLTHASEGISGSFKATLTLLRARCLVLKEHPNAWKGHNRPGPLRPWVIWGAKNRWNISPSGIFGPDYSCLGSNLVLASSCEAVKHPDRTVYVHFTRKGALGRRFNVHPLTYLVKPSVRLAPRFRSGPAEVTTWRLIH